MLDKNFCVVVASALALLAFVVIMWLSPVILASVGWTVCVKDQCTLQSWLGALSGWIGAAVTLATLLVLIRQQKRDAQRFRRPLDLLCERVIIACAQLREETALMLAGRQMIMEEQGLQWFGMERCIEAIGRVYGILGPIQDPFSLSIANTDRFTTEIHARTQAINTDVARFRDPTAFLAARGLTPTPDDVAQTVMLGVEAIEKYSAFCQREAENFMLK